MLRAEDRRPLRRARLPRARRQLTNLTLGAGSLAAANLVQRAVIEPLLARDAGRTGLARLLPPRARGVAAFLVLDWMMYWWHRATHQLDPLWRLHRVHHVDMDLDMSTALRFHALDQLVSAPMRALMIVVSGADARSHGAWNAFFFASVLFHHSNIRLPRRFDCIVALVLTSPRMHGIHHMARRDATDSNWTSGLSFWDRLHGTFRLGPSPEALAIGVPAYAEDMRAGALMSLPFTGGDAASDWR